VKLPSDNLLCFVFFIAPSPSSLQFIKTNNIIPLISIYGLISGHIRRVLGLCLLVWILKNSLAMVQFSFNFGKIISPTLLEVLKNKNTDLECNREFGLLFELKDVYPL
jgi:hypothetical protein